MRSWWARASTLTGRARRGDQQTPIGLDRHVHPGERAIVCSGLQPAQRGEPVDVITDPLPDQQQPAVVDDRHVVMVLRSSLRFSQ